MAKASPTPRSSARARCRALRPARRAGALRRRLGGIVGDAVVVVGGQGALERRGDVDVLVLPERKEIIAPMAGSGVLSVVAQLRPKWV